MKKIILLLTILVFLNVKLSTSDGEDYTLKRGEGSYSYAGALEWKTKSLPDYCKGQTPLIALELAKKSLGKVLEKQYITLRVGETSGQISHPTIKRVKFTATIDGIEEICE